MMKTVERKIDKLGRIVLPMDFRKALRLEGEVPVLLAIDGNTIVVTGAKNICRLCGSAKEVSKHLNICTACIRKIQGTNV